MTKPEAKRIIDTIEAKPRSDWTTDEYLARLAARSFLIKAAKSKVSPERRAAAKARRGRIFRNGF